LVESDGEDSDKASFESTGYASYSEHMRIPESTDDEGSSKLKFPVFNSNAIFGEVKIEEGM
jgi:hypothetical protein